MSTEPECVGRIPITWPNASNCTPLFSELIAIHDVDHDAPLLTVTAAQVNTVVGSAITADLTLLVDTDGNPATAHPFNGARDEDGNERTGVFRYLVVGMNTRDAEPAA